MIETRGSWGHTAPLGPAMRLPADEVWIHHTAMSVPGDFRVAMRAIESVGIQRFGRFSYSYAIHPSGRIGEGAGTRVGAHTKGHNSRAFGIVFMGNLSLVDPTPEALNACRWLIAELVRVGRLKPGTYPTAGHRDNPSSPSECPGNRLYPHVRGSLRVPWTDEEDDVALSDDDIERIAEVITPRIVDALYREADKQEHEAGFGHLNSIVNEVRRNVRRIGKALKVSTIEGGDPDADGG